MRALIAALACLTVAPVAAQTLPECTTPSASHVAVYSETLLNWQPVAVFDDFLPIPEGAVVTYTVYRGTRTPGSFAAMCTTLDQAALLAAQPPGENVYAITATIPDHDRSRFSATVIKDNTEPVPPPIRKRMAAPTGVTIQ
jgi:hypothetical protein